jgi:parvulin-like peptidyl-prolyl isomerase
MKKPKKPKLSKAIKRPFKGVSQLSAKRRVRNAEQKVSDALGAVPRITDETLEEHREQVLSSARKHIYPLQHSKQSIVRISLGLLAAVLVAFFVLVGLSLYKFQNTGGFTYDVTRIVPFPVAKAGHKWVSYESYLFELRRNMHYYQTQQQATFTGKDGKAQLQRLKQQAMAQVVQDAYVKQLAAEHGVGVSDKQVDEQLALVRNQNRLGNNNRVFKEVLSEFWGWNEADFKRELKQQLLKQAVVTKLDTKTTQRANSTLSQLKGGADFAKTATDVSDDFATKPTGGTYPNPITINDRELPPTITAALFKLQPNQISGIVNTGYTLDIVKVLDRAGNSLHGAHIQFNLEDINTYVKPLQQKQPAHQYIKL